MYTYDEIQLPKEFGITPSEELFRVRKRRIDNSQATGYGNIPTSSLKPSKYGAGRYYAVNPTSGNSTMDAALPTSVMQPVVQYNPNRSLPTYNAITLKSPAPAISTPMRAYNNVSPETVTSKSSVFNDKLFLEYLKGKESKHDYKAVNKYNYLGGYQMGALALADVGLVKKGTTNSQLDDPKRWLKGDKFSFLSNPAVQDNAVAKLVKLNRKRLKQRLKGKSVAEQYGLLGAAHLLGATGSENLDKSDANNVKGIEYYHYFKSLKY